MSSFDSFAENLPRHHLPDDVQERHLAMLRELAAEEQPPTPRGPSRRRLPRPLVTGGVVVLVAAGGGGTAAAFGLFSNSPSRTDTAYCYASADLDDSPTNRIEFAVDANGKDQGDAATAAPEVCAVYWRSGVFSAGAADPSHVPADGGHQPVPPLTACILKSGALAVFPGDAETCSQLGLARARPK